MNAIEKIIFNVLASRRAVTLPGVGTLAVERRGATVSGRDVKAPVNRVVFSGAETEGVPTLPGLMEFMGVDPDQANANYDQWLNEVSTGYGLSIKGVGTLRKDSFEPSAELDQILNPAATAATDGTGRLRRGNCLTNILLIIAIVLLLALGGLYVRNTYCIGCQRVTAVLTSVPAEIPAVLPEPAEAAAPDAVKRFHVVAGAFARESNADAMIRWYKVNYPELTPEKYTHRNGLMVVSLFSTDDEREALRKMRSLAYLHYKTDYWVCRVGLTH